MKKRVCLVILDSVGIGELPDAAEFHDEGSHTLGNINKAIKLNIPNLYKMGLGDIENSTLIKEANPTAAYCRLAEVTKAKDTTSGHFEIAGVPLDKPFRTFPNGFPQSFIEEFEKAIGRKVIGNEVASGTEIITRLGSEHVKTGCPIVYTSADSVFQIAAHEEIISIPELYKMCKIAFDMLQGDMNVGRIIARPFLGVEGNFTRTENRKDFAAKPPKDTILDGLIKNGKTVHAIGKIEDIFANQGISSANHTKNNASGIDATIEALKNNDDDLIFTNLVDFDMLYGHRNDVEGYAKALEYFDSRLLEIVNELKDDDILILSADHGCDPTTASTDHSREYIPCLIYGKNVKPIDLKTRSSFADIGASIYEYLGLGTWDFGTSFIKEIIK